MVNALKPPGINPDTTLIHQSLHGYKDGHRLLKSSFKLQDDLARLMLRMSDLSGSSVVGGFEEYVTGYPLAAIDAYVLAKTWYASEMPRPGCVWTHSLVIPARTMSEIPSLFSLMALFKRPALDVAQDNYGQDLPLENVYEQSNSFATPGLVARKVGLGQLLWAYYVLLRPIILPAETSEDFERDIFALWSQQWPGLRLSFTFCTGSLSARRLAGRPFDVQCVPAPLVRDVLRESHDDRSTGRPLLLPDSKEEVQPWIDTAVIDARKPNGGPLRQFLWEAAGDNATPTVFTPITKIFEAIRRSPEVGSLVHLVAECFPSADDGIQAKRLLFGNTPQSVRFAHYEEQDVLLALATTSDSGSFVTEELSLRERAATFTAAQPSRAGQLVAQLFWSTLNPLGEEILAGFISAMSLQTAEEVGTSHPQFLPALFRANPSLAAYPELWLAGRDRKRELFDAVAANGKLQPDLVRKVVDSLLATGLQQFISRACNLWGRDAIYEVLDRAEDHDDSLVDTCREAILSHLPLVMEWVQEGRTRSTNTLVALTHVIAPYSTKLLQYDSTEWVRTFHHLKDSGNVVETDYVCAFLLALAFGNAPPSPLQLVSLSFERVHESAKLEVLSESAWIVLEPLVPELSWRKNWDKCERLRRALISSFVKHRWSALELQPLIRNYDLFLQLLKSAGKVDGGGAYFKGIA